ncbi:hypothetical protein ZHAS_00001145 [Anopheles sinensis]|uniref:Uncharacterized protein n=1 Tax=Anopheles sinensis TaxID=74873 RepID=A0A084VB27_ANOSI|nr:hypothetical protein ZHAS_00001145 [Anopheles sinensis]
MRTRVASAHTYTGAYQVSGVVVSRGDSLPTPGGRTIRNRNRSSVRQEPEAEQDTEHCYGATGGNDPPSG